MKRLALATISIAALAFAACSQGGPSGEAALQPSDAEINTLAENFQLTDQKHDAWELRYFADAPAIVLVSHKLGDAVSTGSAVELEAMQSAYKDKGVEIFMINSDPGVTRAAVAEEATAKGYPSVRVLLDEYQLVGENLGVTQSGEAFVIDPKTWKVVYHGPLDDRFAAEGVKKATIHPVTAALDSLLAGQPVELASYKTTGAAIAFPERDNKAAHANISYVNDVAPMLVAQCASCHTQGGIAPFAMNSYDMVKGFAPMIREAVRTDRMPPFFADRHTGTWKHDGNLSPDQIKTLIHWIEAGAPRGEGEDPLPTAVKPAPEWPLGKPDLVLNVPSFDVPETGVVDYQYPAVKNPLTETKWLRAATVLPSARTNVHHVLSGWMEKMPKDGAPASQANWRGSMGSYTPGQEAQILPDNSGVELPPGGAIGFQMHYTTSGKADTDKTKIGLYFHEKPPTFIKRSSVIIDATIELKPQTANLREVAYMTFPKEATLYTVYPHAHYRGVQASLEAHYPDGTKELILDLPKYDFNWQRDYDLAEPKIIPPGTRMVARFTYDNSTRNHANPDPNKTVTWGDQTFEEMFYMRMNYRWNDETLENRVGEKYDGQLMQSLMTGMVDDDLNGKVEGEENIKFANAMKMFAAMAGGGGPAPAAAPTPAAGTGGQP